MVLVARSSREQSGAVARGVATRRIVSTHPGRDGKLKAVTVRTQCRSTRDQSRNCVCYRKRKARTVNRLNVVFRLEAGMCLPLPEFPVPFTVNDALIGSRYEHVRF